MRRGRLSIDLASVRALRLGAVEKEQEALSVVYWQTYFEFTFEGIVAACALLLPPQKFYQLLDWYR